MQKHLTPEKIKQIDLDLAEADRISRGVLTRAGILSPTETRRDAECLAGELPPQPPGVGTGVAPCRCMAKWGVSRGILCRIARRLQGLFEPTVEEYDDPAQAIKRALEVPYALLVRPHRKILPPDKADGSKEHETSKEPGKEQNPSNPKVPRR